jgi:hypothetical protein
MRELMLAAGVCCIGAIAPSATAAAEIYKCVSGDGLTYYTESPPEGRDCQLLTLEPLQEVPSVASDPAYQSALEVAREIEASRLERERVRLERERLRLEREQAESERPREYVQEPRYYPVYPWYSGKHPHAGHFGHERKRPPHRGWSAEPWPRGGGRAPRVPARVPGFGGR